VSSFANTIAFAEVGHSTLSPKLRLSEPTSSAEIQAAVICELIERRVKAWEGKTIEQIYTDDIAQWKKSTEPIFEGCEFTLEPDGIRIYLPNSNLCVRYYDSAEKKEDIDFGLRDNNIITFPAYYKGSEVIRCSDDVINDVRTLDIAGDGFVLFRPQEGIDFRIVTPYMTRCTAICVRVKDREGIYRYGLGHIVIPDRTSISLSDHLLYIHQQLVEKYGFSAEDITYFVSYHSPSYRIEVKEDEIRNDPRLGLNRATIGFMNYGNPYPGAYFHEVKSSGVTIRRAMSSTDEKLLFKAHPEEEKTYPWSSDIFIASRIDTGPEREPSRDALKDLLIKWFGNFDLTGGLKEWIFDRDMSVGASNYWWGDRKRRKIPHEGIDLYSYKDLEGNMRHIQAGDEVSAIYDGEIVCTIDDFIGKTIFMKHNVYDDAGNQLYTIFGHIDPRDIKKADRGDLIATVADSAKKNRTAPSHLHVTMAYLPKNFPSEKLNWKIINSEIVSIIDPLNDFSIGNSPIQNVLIPGTDWQSVKTYAVNDHINRQILRVAKLLPAPETVSKKDLGVTGKAPGDDKQLNIKNMELGDDGTIYMDGYRTHVTKKQLMNFITVLKTEFAHRPRTLSGKIHLDMLDIGTSSGRTPFLLIQVLEQNGFEIKFTGIDQCDKFGAKYRESGHVELIQCKGEDVISKFGSKCFDVAIWGGYEGTFLFEDYVADTSLKKILRDDGMAVLCRWAGSSKGGGWYEREIKKSHAWQTQMISRELCGFPTAELSHAGSVHEKIVAYEDMMLAKEKFSEPNYQKLFQNVADVANAEPTTGTADESEITNFTKANMDVASIVLADPRNPILFRYSVEELELIGVDNARMFLETLQNNGGYVELYYSTGRNEAVSQKVYERFGADRGKLKEFDKRAKGERTKENTVTLFPLLKGEVSSDEKEARDDIQKLLLDRLGDIEDDQTQIVPIGRLNDQAGLIRGTILGLRLIHIARYAEYKKSEGKDIDREFIKKWVEPLLTEYKTLSRARGMESFDFEVTDIIDFATSDDMNARVRALKKLIDLLPIIPIDPEELRMIYEHVSKQFA